MLENQIITVEDSGAVFISPETLNLIGVKAGDKIEISLADRSLVVRSVADADAEREFEEVADEVFNRRDYVLRRLAEGAK